MKIWTDNNLCVIMIMLSAVTPIFERRKDMKKDILANSPVEKSQNISNIDTSEAVELFSKLSPTAQDAILDLVRELAAQN